MAVIADRNKNHRNPIPNILNAEYCGVICEFRARYLPFSSLNNLLEDREANCLEDAVLVPSKEDIIDIMTNDCNNGHTQYA
jgi:hypothetical protein